MPCDLIRGERGLSLIELVVAILVLSLGTLAALSAFGAARRSIGGEVARALALAVAHNRAEELALAGAGADLPGRVRMGPQTWTVAVEEELTAAGLVEATIRVTAPGQPGAALVAYLPVGTPP